MQYGFFARLGCLCLILISSSVLSLSVHAGWMKQSRDMMGTVIAVEAWATNQQTTASCVQQVFDEFQRIENSMSPYIENSELSQVNRNAAKQAVSVSPELFNLLKKSQDFSRLSGGAFDITYASVGYLYDYRQQQRPDAETIQQTLAAIDYRNLLLQDNQIRFTRPGVRIDLGGIAKGYAVDKAINILQQCDIKHAIVSAGGDSRILGDKKGRPWIIGIQHPRQKNAYALRIPLSHTAFSTSGDYERYFLTNNERIHHIINPQTGSSAKNSWSASVIGPDATTTDALSTTLFVLGAEKGIQLIDSMPDLDAIIIDSNGKIHYSSGLVSADESEQIDTQ